LPGREATGTVWFTLFDAEADRQFARRQQNLPAAVPAGGWVEAGQSTFGPGGLRGECFESSWDLTFTPRAPAFFHLPRPKLYDFPVPKTNPISPVPDGDFTGEIQVGDRRISLEGWRGMIGHNWGAEHAERWIWLHGSCFGEAPDAWIDIAMGRLRIAGRLLPWVANGAVHSGGQTRRVGGLFARGVEVAETPRRLDAKVPVNGGGSLELEIDSPENMTVGWQYGDPADPDSEAHEVANCSAAAMTAKLSLPDTAAINLATSHGAVYELGMTETDHGIPISSGFPPEAAKAGPE
jgi:hypothetical protein